MGRVAKQKRLLVFSNERGAEGKVRSLGKELVLGEEGLFSKERGESAQTMQEIG